MTVVGRKLKTVTKKNVSRREETAAKRTTNTRKIWPQAVKNILLDHFKRCIKNGDVPGKKDCEKFLVVHKTNNFFCSLPWKDIKYGVYNVIQKVNKRNY